MSDFAYVPVPDPRATTLATAEERRKMASDVRRARPHLLVTWRGWSVRGQHVNPYIHFARTYTRQRPRDEQVADLLVGDLFATVLLDEDLQVFSRREPN